MINAKFNFVLKVMFWITRQPINQVIDNPDSSPQKQEWGDQRVSSLFSEEDESWFFGGGLTIHMPRFTAVLQLLVIAQGGFRRLLELEVGPGLSRWPTMSGPRPVDALLAHGRSSGGPGMLFLGGETLKGQRLSSFYPAAWNRPP